MPPFGPFRIAFGSLGGTPPGQRTPPGQVGGLNAKFLFFGPPGSLCTVGVGADGTVAILKVLGPGWPTMSAPLRRSLSNAVVGCTWARRDGVLLICATHWRVCSSVLIAIAVATNGDAVVVTLGGNVPKIVPWRGSCFPAAFTVGAELREDGLEIQCKPRGIDSAGVETADAVFGLSVSCGGFLAVSPLPTGTEGERCKSKVSGTCRSLLMACGNSVCQAFSVALLDSNGALLALFVSCGRSFAVGLPVTGEGGK